VPEYEVVATTGEAHAQQFEVDCRIPALTVTTHGSGTSRRAAEQNAAAAAFACIVSSAAHG
jgi:ribonuclease-3